MRINRFVATASGMSRRSADLAIKDRRVKINGHLASLSNNVLQTDKVSLDGKTVKLPSTSLTIMLNKPVGYVCSQNGQGAQTIYDLLPQEYSRLKSVGRLDKESSGLILLTDDGQLAFELTHPSHSKIKRYRVVLDNSLEPVHQKIINDQGISLTDGLSRLELFGLDKKRLAWQVAMHEGRNRQIRRTFGALGYNVKQLHRFSFGPYRLNQLAVGKYIIINK
jgi:23S rRNA pseudouridine2605 synthase